MPDSGEQVHEVTADPTTPQRLYFHVGLPKSGSTFIQTVLGTNRFTLRELGHVYPFVRQEGMFHAAVEMAGMPERWGLDPDQIRGTFAHLLRRSRRIGGTAIISHEIFGAATPEQIAAMGEMLADFEVHVVVTARDLARTITAEWQERVKNGSTWTFEAFADMLLADLPEDPAVSEAWWPSQNLVGVMGRWQQLVPPERFHLVPCPPDGAPREELWRRFAEAVELPWDAVDLAAVPARNESLGTGQVAFLRQVLESVDGRLEQPWHSRIAKRWFAQTLLATARSHRPVAPPTVTDRLAGVSRAWNEAVRASGCPVHGELADLMPEVAAADAPHPDEVTDADMLGGLPDVVAEMLVRTKDLSLEARQLRGSNRDLTRERDELVARVAELEEAAAQPPPPWRESLRRRFR